MPDATAYAAQTVTETEKESKVLDISGSEDAGEESGDGENSEENRGGVTPIMRVIRKAI